MVYRLGRLVGKLPPPLRALAIASPVILVIVAFVAFNQVETKHEPTLSEQYTRPIEKPYQPTQADIEINLVLAGARALKEAMKKPESFELLSATLMSDKSICYEYRARNSFNDRTKETFVMRETDGGTSASSWNRHCAGKSGTDYSSVRAVL